MTMISSTFLRGPLRCSSRLEECAEVLTCFHVESHVIRRAGAFGG